MKSGTVYRVFVLITACSFCFSCAHIKYRNQTSIPISFTHNLGVEQEYKAVRSIDDNYRRMWLLFYLIPVGSDGSDMIARSAAGSEGVVNLKIKAQYDFLDVLITNLTSGIFCTRKVNIRGDLIQFLDQEPTPPKPRENNNTSTSIICQACNHVNNANAKFCVNCGKKLQAPIFCPSCGTKNAGNASFCINCGTKLPVKKE